jgi:tetratricopeptide (TPR) repeat protein
MQIGALAGGASTWILLGGLTFPALAADGKAAHPKRSETLAAATGTPAGIPAGGIIEPAAERAVRANPKRPPSEVGARGTGVGHAPPIEGAAGQPAITGPRLPDGMRARLKGPLDARVSADLAKAKELRVVAIAILTQFIAEAPREAREMPEALTRLGELQWENERETFVSKFETWDKRPTDERGPAPELDYRVARETFARVLDDYPWFDQYDLALYIDGFLAFEQGKEDDARQRFERILRDYPQSRFVPDAHMAKAEAIFDGRFDYAGAKAEYNEVLTYKAQIDPALYGLALFKSAWCYWRLGDNDEATRRFVGVFQATDVSRPTGPGVPPTGAADRRQLDELQGEALKYVVEVFSEDEKNTAQDLTSFLAKIGGQRFTGKIVRALAEQFYDQAHYERGIEAYELLLELEPTSRDAGLWVLQIAAGYEALEDWARLKTTFERAVAGYTTGGAWAHAQNDATIVESTTARIEKALRDDATTLHARAQRDRTSTAEFEGAAGLYGVYLSRFAADPPAFEVHFDLAEIDFFRLGKNVDAAVHYLAAARAIPPGETSGPLATMRHDALYNVLVALSRAMDASPSTGEPGKGGVDPVDQYAAALDLYIQFYPRDPELPAMFYRQGRYFNDRGKYDLAVKIWGMLIEKFPNSEPSRGAGESILESFSRAKNYENIETWARRLKAVPSFSAAKHQQRLDALIVVAVFKQGEQDASSGDHATAAAAYLRAAKEFPADTHAAQACVNAEQEAKLAADSKTLEEAATLVMGTQYAGRPESPAGAWIAMTTLEAMGLFGEAADVAERMTTLGDSGHPNYAHFDHEKDAAYNAVILREAIGDHGRAIADGNAFLARYAAGTESDEIVLQIGRAEQNAGHPRDAAELYRRYVGRTKSADRRVEGLVLLAGVELKMGDDRASAAALDQAIAYARQHTRDLGADGKYAASHARYMRGERILAKFEQIQIQGDVKQLKARLRQKADLLKEAAKVFLESVSLGVAEWTTAALYQIGHMYEAFAKALRESPPPADARTEEDKAAYEAQIEEFAVPMEERSLDAYENGWKKSADLGIYNQWTAKMREALGRLNGEIYPPFNETGFEVRSQGPLPLPPLIAAPNRPEPASGDRMNAQGDR